MRRSLLVLCSGLLLLVASVAAQEAPVGPFTEVETAICTSIVDRQAVGEAEVFDVSLGELFFWTKCIGATDSTVVTHVWTHEGETRATVELPGRSSSWRAYSSKKLLPSWTGNWEVRILDIDGNILKAVSFAVEKPAPMPEPQPVEEKPSDSM